MNEMKLDGNAVAGTLEQMFAFEVTTAIGTCANCGAVGAVGAASVYSQAPGIVVRCPACEGVLLRLAPYALGTPVLGPLSCTGLHHRSR